MNDSDWKDRVKGLLKSELAKRNIKYAELAELLKQHDIDESPQNLSNKIARGTFSAFFMLQVLDVIGCEQLNIKV